jgi:hypothetical protein
MRYTYEVVLVDPPYRIPQPEVFAASVLSVEINNAVGFSRKSRWAISLTFDGRTEVTQLQWNPDTNTLEPKRIDSMEWEISPVTSFVCLNNINCGESPGVVWRPP